MLPFEPACLATAIGSVPHTEALRACELVFEMFPDIPFWPQLPKRSRLENMYYQFASNLPATEEHDGKLVMHTAEHFEEAVMQFYQKYLDSGQDAFALSAERAKGFFAFCEMAENKKPTPSGYRFFAVKAQVTGPISYGLALSDENGKPVLYNEMAMDCICKNIAMVSCWQEDALSVLNAPTIMCVDEPSMATYGSAFFNYGSELVSHYLELATEGVRSLIAVHCCANTDWSLLLDSPASILSFDAYGYSDKLLLYAEQIGEFFQRGGALGVGIVPSQADAASKETVDSLLERLDAFYESLAVRGISPELAKKRTLITPSCGLGSQSEADAETILNLTSQLSRRAREAYSLVGKQNP